MTAPRPAASFALPSERRLALVGDEGTLVARIRSGDEAAFEILFRAYFPGLWSFALAMLRAPDVAEECVQDVFWWVWEHRAGWDVRDGVRTYLYGAVRNGAANVLKRRAVVERWQARAVAGGDSRGIVGEAAANPQELIEARELADMVERVVAAMPERRRLAFTLRTRHHLTYPEIARVMGISVKGVELHLTLALKAVRGALAERG